MRGLVATLAGALVLLSGTACSPSGDCAEKATCADTADAAVGDDTGPVPDASAAEGGQDATTGDDSAVEAGDASDAHSVPDVVFVDSATCPTGSTCIDPVPGGWVGPLALFDQTGGPPPAQAPACPTSFATDAYDGNAVPTSPQAVCGCTCTAMNTTCNGASAASITVYPDPTCMASSCGNVTLPYTSPQPFCVGTGCTGGQGAVVTQGPGSGACATTPSTQKPAWGWTETARACQPASVGGGCSGAQVCVPVPPSPFLAKLCILQTGDVSCPNGSSYSLKHTFYGGVNDGRSCTAACACGAVTGVTCSGGAVAVYSQYSGSMCGGTMQGIPVDGVCHALSPLIPGNVFAQSTAPATPSGGTCTATANGQPQGSVMPASPTTVCCQP